MEKRFGKDFPGKAFPFGSGVYFKPAVTKYKTNSQPPNMEFGIFLGYRLAAHDGWNGEYLVASLEDFADLNLRSSEPNSKFRLYPHVTKQIALPEEGFSIHSPSDTNIATIPSRE